ncbi:MAG: hypothetical protein JXR07_19100 [Reichenbachiella sp.]
MNKLIILLLAVFANTGLFAQSLTPYTEYKIKEGVSIQIKDIQRVEKYGWDNLEVNYVLKNESNFEIQKLDFMIHLLDKNQNEIGTIDAHVFDIPRLSEREMKFVEIGSEFVNDKIATFIPETTHFDIIVEDKESQLVSIKGTKSIGIK